MGPFENLLEKQPQKQVPRPATPPVCWPTASCSESAQSLPKAECRQLCHTAACWREATGPRRWNRSPSRDHPCSIRVPTAPRAASSVCPHQPSLSATELQVTYAGAGCGRALRCGAWSFGPEPRKHWEEQSNSDPAVLCRWLILLLGSPRWCQNSLLSQTSCSKLA